MTGQIFLAVDAVAAWLLTYLVHSTVVLAAAMVLLRVLFRRAPASADMLLKVALVVPMFTASSAVLAPNLSLAAPVELASRIGATNAVREVRAVVADGSGGPVERVERTELKFPAPLAQKANLHLLLVAVWALGVTALGLRRLQQRAAFRRRLKSRTPLERQGGVLGSAFARLNARLPASRRDKMVLSISPEIRSPIVISGKEICVPLRAVDELDAGAHMAVLAHESAHVVRGDYLWVSVFEWTRIVLFLQPLNSLLARCWRDAAELICDDIAVDLTGERLDLARSLTTVAGWSLHPEWHPAATGSGRRLSARVERLVSAGGLVPVRGAHLALICSVAALILTPVMLLPAAFTGGVTSRESEIIKILHGADQHFDAGDGEELQLQSFSEEMYEAPSFTKDETIVRQSTADAVQSQSRVRTRGPGRRGDTGSRDAGSFNAGSRDTRPRAARQGPEPGIID